MWYLASEAYICDPVLKQGSVDFVLSKFLIYVANCMVVRSNHVSERFFRIFIE